MKDLTNVAECLVLSFLSDVADPHCDRFTDRQEAELAILSCGNVGSAEACLETTLRGERVLLLATVQIFKGINPNDTLRSNDDDDGTNRPGVQ